MDLNFEEAFSFVKQDKDWKMKLAIGGMLSFLCVLLFVLPFLFVKALDNFSLVMMFTLCFIVNVFLTLGLIGYPYAVANNRINNRETILPEWSNFTALIATGVKFLVGYCLFSIPLSIAYTVAMVLFMCMALISDEGAKVVFGILVFLIIFAIIALAFIYTLASYLMMASFSTDLKVLSFINFKKAWELMKDNWINYLILLLLVIAVSIILQFALIILSITIIGILLLPLLVFYTGLVNADLIAQFVKTKKI